jgi:non-ribosomal peptide synthetase-like protein
MPLAGLDPPPTDPARTPGATGSDRAADPALLHGWFALSAHRFPDAPAVVCGTTTLTYSELEARSDILARHLRALGIGRGDLIGLLLERGPEVYVALLAILKAGAAYVPLDPDYPHDRIIGILDDCTAPAVVTASAFDEHLSGWKGRVVRLDADAAAIARHPAVPIPTAETGVRPSDLAYVIFTSGSTGRPKGVMVEHRSASHLVRVERELYRMSSDDRVFQGFSVAFDASVEEVWMAFANGSALVVGTREVLQAGPDLGRVLTEQNVTAFSTVPTLLAMLDGDLPTVRLLILGGEACPPELVARWCKPGRRLLNTYGPTEATVIATASECSPGRPVTIGKPIPGYTVYLLDEHRQPVLPGQAGELYIGGVGVARGYVGRDDLTAERFVPNPFRPGRLYRTGDLGRWTPDGEIEYLGRCDSQVKIRGYRVELTEIEAVMLGAPGVRAAAANLHTGPDGVARLVGYVVSHGPEPVCEEALRAHLRGRLPAYMVPTVFEPLAELPVLTSGKVDRKRLPPPRHHDDTATTAPRVAPRTPLEGRIAAAWEKLFDRPVSVTDDFFLDLGGHSLLAARLVSGLRVEGDLAHAAVPDVYHHPTVEKLAAHLASRACERPEAAPPPAAHAAGSPRVRHFLCGLGQFFALYVVLGVASLQWIGPFLVYAGLVAEGWAVVPALAAALVSLLAVYPVMLAAGVLTKWALIGRFRPGRYPLWGWFYFRWWFTRAVLTVVPTGYLVGTPLLGLYYRLLGARIGRNVYLGTDDVLAFDLLTVGDDTCIGTDVGLLGYTVERGELVIGPITIGKGCTVGNRSLLQAGAVLHDGAVLDEMSLLRGNQEIPAGERWGGSPARRVADEQPREVHRPSLGRRFALALTYAVGSGLLPLFAIAAFLPGVVGLNWLSHHTPGYSYLLAAPLVAASFVVLFALEIAAIKWLLLGRLTAGSHSRHGIYQLRKWFVDQLMKLSLDITGTLYATIYLNPWYRLLGMKVGRRAEVSTASEIPFDLLTLGDESFVADAVSLGGPRVSGDTVTVGPVTLGAKAFAGNGAHVPPGGELGYDGLLGCLSVLPPEAARAGTAWVGSPPFRLPQRQQSAAFPVETISKPPLKLWLLRGFIEFFRVILPPTGLVLLTSLLIGTALGLMDRFSLAAVLLLFPLLYAAGATAAALFVVLLKWVVVGRYKPTERPLWSGFVWRTELVTGVREHLADFFLVGLLKGTPFVGWYFRLLGAKVGRRVFLDTTDLCEYDLTTIGDEAAVNHDATLQTHLFEDRVMKVDAVTVGAGAAVGAWTLVLYDTRLGDRAAVEELSLVMKGEVLPPGTRWAGIPAARAVI